MKGDDVRSTFAQSMPAPCSLWQLTSVLGTTFSSDEQGCAGTTFSGHSRHEPSLPRRLTLCNSRRPTNFAVFESPQVESAKRRWVREPIIWDTRTLVDRHLSTIRPGVVQAPSSKAQRPNRNRFPVLLLKLQAGSGKRGLAPSTHRPETWEKRGHEVPVTFFHGARHSAYEKGGGHRPRTEND